LEYDLESFAGIASFALPGIPFPMFDRLGDARIVGFRAAQLFVFVRCGTFGATKEKEFYDG
jgi:hypothetical protein